ncbi:diacylglycerol/polyprenol kinase family protein, partial [Bacteroidota bacterium]
MTIIDKGTIDYKTEILRKAIHFCSLSIAIVYYFIPKELALKILIPLTVISLIIDLARYFIPPFSNIFYFIFGFMLRQHEKDTNKKTLNGATYVLLAATLVVLIFPKAFVVPAVAILIVGDISAALIGRKFGKHKFLSKSLEGTIAFIIAGAIVIILAPKVEGYFIEYIIGFIAVFVGGIAENISYGWADDNLTVPLAICLTLALLYYLFLPGV